MTISLTTGSVRIVSINVIGWTVAFVTHEAIRTSYDNARHIYSVQRLIGISLPKLLLLSQF